MHTPLSRTLAVGLAALAAVGLTVTSATAADADPAERLAALSDQLAAATEPVQVQAVLADLPPVFDDLREITDSPDALHLLANTEAFTQTAGDLPVAVAATVVPALLDVVDVVVDRDSISLSDLLPGILSLPR
ncbi:hypothetical protein [Actinokineospora enzanensis]|uniref:hypothetical protein n=1 Tax=Actinokineospora enzanensis TaxID=155975 RepID=UPI00036C9850|nr:hypothetical protein [Actinokineospora enzanensis]